MVSALHLWLTVARSSGVSSPRDASCVFFYSRVVELSGMAEVIWERVCSLLISLIVLIIG